MLHEFKQVIRKNDINFMNILNGFRTTSQIFEIINFINIICFKAPPMDNILPYLFNQMLKQQHNNLFHTTLGQTFEFLSLRYPF
jgi:hypothetical protein